MVAALLWKAILHPGQGLLAQTLSIPGWDTPILAGVVIGIVNVWVWGLSGAAFVSVLFDRETVQARDLYLLDGGRPALANWWTLWCVKRPWLGVLLLALSIENLRGFEIVSVLTGGTSNTGTLTFQVYQNRMGSGNQYHEACWAVLLVVLNAACTLVLFSAVGKRNSWRSE